MTANGCKNLAEFRALPAEKLFATWQNLKKTKKGGGCFPCVDGRFVVGTGSELLKAGKQKRIAYMAGCTSEDMMPPVLHMMAKDWCVAQKEKSYVWFFDRQLPGDENGAWHSSDLWYWFGTLENCWRPMTMKDNDISNQMTDYLANFCKYGDPNGAGLTAWLPTAKGQSKVLCIGEKETHMGKPNMLKLTKTMLTNKAVGE
jgi:para-nitrobenzyl esterase